MVDELCCRSSLGDYTTFGLTPQFGPVVQRDRQSDCAERDRYGDRNDQDNPDAKRRGGKRNA